MLAPDARRAIVVGNTPGSIDSPLMVYDLEQQAALESIANNVSQFDYAPAAELVVYLKQRDTAIYVRSLNDKQERTLERPAKTSYIAWLTVSPDGKWLAFASSSEIQKDVRFVEVWDLPAGTLKFKHTFRGAIVSDLAFQPNTGLLAVATDEVVELWDLDREHVRKMFHGRQIRQLAFSADGKLLAGGGGTMEDPMLVLWDATPEPVETNGDARTLKGVGPVSLSRDGTRYWSLENDDLVSHRLADDEETARVSGKFGGTLRMAFSPDEKHAVLSSQHDTYSNGLKQHQRLQLVELESATIKHALDIPFLFPSFHFSADGRHVYVVNDSDLIRWDVDSGTSDPVVRNLGRGYKMSFVLSPDGGLAAIGSYDQNTKESVVTLYDLATSKVLHRLPVNDHYVKSAAFSADGSKLATGSRSQVVIWDVAQGRQDLRIQTNSSSWAESLAFSPVDGLLATYGNGQPLTIWSWLSGDRMISFVSTSAARVESESVAFTPDGRFLLITASRKPVQLLDRKALPVEQTLKKKKR